MTASQSTGKQTGGRARRALPTWLVPGAVGLVVAAVAGLAVVALVDSWSPAGWGAAAAWAGVLIAGVVGGVAIAQLAEARQLRRDQAQPYVAAFMEHNGEVDSKFVDLVIRNFGATAAYDVRISIDPPPARAKSGEYTEVWIPDEIPVLVPGQEWRTLWDFSPQRAKTELPSRHLATITFRDTAGRPFSLDYVLDWNVSRRRMHVTTYGVHHAAKALRGIEDNLRRAQESAAGGLAVTVRDGDAKDARRRAELDSDDVPHGPWIAPSAPPENSAEES